MDALLAAFARHVGLPPEAARPTLDALLGALREGLDAEGTSTLAGVGRFYRSGEERHFEPAPLLLAAVNAPFAGLPPVAPSAPAPAEVPPAAPEALETEPREEEAPEPEEETWPPLFSVPVETVEEDEELTAPALDVPKAPPPPKPARSEHAPIAPVPAGPDTPPPPDEEEEDAFGTPEASPPPEQAAPPPLRDLSSEDEAPDDTVPSTPPDAPYETPREDEAVLEAETVTEEPQEEETPEEEGLTDDQLDALLAGVWAPSNSASRVHPLGPTSEPDIEDAEYDVVGEPDEPILPEEADFETVTEAEADTEAEPAPEVPAAPPPFVPLKEDAPAPPPFAAVAQPEGRSGPESRATPPPEAPRRARGPVFWLPLLALLLAVLVIAFLWPRFGGDEAPVAAQVEPPPAAALPDTGGFDEGPADTAFADVPVPGLLPGEDAEADAEAAEPLPPTAEAGPPAEQALPDEPSSAEGGIPAPLRGPGGIDAALGGATWVLGSGARAGAERDAARLRQQGYRADVLPGTSGGRPVYRVVVGQFSTFEAALRYRDALPPGTPSGAWVLRL